MAIDSLRDGFVRLCFDTSANQLAEKCKLVIEGKYLDGAAGCTTTAVPNKLVKLASIEEAACLFGNGSELTSALRAAFDCCANNAVDIYALPRQVTGTNRAEFTLKVNGAATSDGTLDIYAGDGRWNISVPISAGDTEGDIERAIMAEWWALGDFPYWFASGQQPDGEIWMRHNTPGSSGNYLDLQVNWQGLTDRVPDGVSLTLTQTNVGWAGQFTYDDYEEVYGECCVCCHVLLSENRTWQKNLIEYLEDQWACDKPQCFGHAYLYNTGSLGEILAADSNSAVASRMAYCDDDPILPYMKIAAYGALSCCTTQDNPELSVQGPNYGVLECVSMPESCSSCFTWDEQEQLREAGFVVTTPLSGGDGALTSPVITNDITNRRYDDDGYENLTFRSVSSRRLATVTAGEIAEQLQTFQGLGYFTDGTAIAAGTKGVNRRLILGQMRAWAKSQEGELFSTFDNLDEDLTIIDDFDVAATCQGVPGKLHLNMVYRPPVRISQVSVSLTPKLLDNC